MRVDIQEVLLRMEEQIRDNEALLARLQPSVEPELPRQAGVHRGDRYRDPATVHRTQYGSWFA